MFADKDLRDELQQVALRAYGQESMPTPEPTPDNMEQNSVDSPVAPNVDSAKNSEFSDDDIPF